MENTEVDLREFIREQIKVANPRGVIECDARGSFAGQVEAGRFRRSPYDFVAMLDKDRAIGGGGPSWEFSELVRQLHEASCAHAFGPFYRLDIKLEGKKIGFEYFWENEPYESLDELRPPISGKTPDFVFKQRFDEALIAFVDDHELDTAISQFVAERRNSGRDVPDALLDMYALISWHWTIVSLGFMQHFASLEEVKQPLPVVEWYERTIRALLKLDQSGAIKVVELSVGLYASLYRTVEPIRSALNFGRVSEIDESDLYERFGVIEREVQEAWRKEIRDNPSPYAVRD